MKNTEWGAIAYLTESRYGRNGKTINYRTSYIKDWPALSKENEVFASTTGNIYGVYGLTHQQSYIMAAFYFDTNKSTECLGR